MADESVYNHHDARMQIESGSCHYVNIKMAKAGGIHEAKKIHDTAAERGIPCMMGGMLESRIALSSKLHFVYASPNIKFYDMDTCMLGHLQTHALAAYTYDGYKLSISNEPGIGADADEAFLKGARSLVSEPIDALFGESPGNLSNSYHQIQLLNRVHKGVLRDILSVQLYFILFRAQLRKILVEQRDGFNPFIVIKNVVFLVWRMQGVAIQSKAH
jgi:hypothetical protein